MTNKQRLVDYVKKHGQTHTWAELAQAFNLGSAEIARHTWRNSKKPTKSQPQSKTSPQQTNPVTLQEQKEYLINEMKKHSPDPKWHVFPKNRNTDDILVELAIFDLHIGKLAWERESGDDYDINIAAQRYRDSVNALLSLSLVKQPDRFLLPIGNDMINIDNKMNTTTSGTPQSSDSRFGKMFQVAKALVIETIEKLVSYAPVDVVVIPGNHDEHTMFTLGEVIDAWFHNNANVRVYNSPKLRKYYRYGKNMIMFTHGDKERIQDLGTIMAAEEPQMWGDTKYREVHMGHFHKSKLISTVNIDENPGYKIRILPSLSGSDAWHHGKGYLSQKAAKAFVWSKEGGLITEHTYNI